MPYLIALVLLLESAYMIGLRTDVVHRDNLSAIQEVAKEYEGHGFILVYETANIDPNETEKILASNDARWPHYKRVATERRDMSLLLVYDECY